MLKKSLTLLVDLGNIDTVGKERAGWQMVVN